MKIVMKILIYIYRLLLQPVMNRFSSCRYEPSCSHYMEQSVEQYGLKGFIMGVQRIFRATPFQNAQSMTQ